MLIQIISLLSNISRAQAQDGVKSNTILDPVVVTATAYPKGLNDITSSVTVITEDEIRLINAESVSELLEQIPGLYVDQPGGRGGVSSVYIRGGDPNFTLVLIDGVEVNDPNNSRGGSFDFSTLSPDNIERIEIVRGAMSALYGSDALSGVINIITKRGEGDGALDMEFSAGTYGQSRSLLRAGGQRGISDYSVSASYLDDGKPTLGSKFKSPAFTANTGLVFSDDLELRAHARYAYIDSARFPEDSGGPDFSVIRQPEESTGDQLSLGLNLSHSPLNWWDYSINTGFYYSSETIDSPGVAPGERDMFGIPPNESNSDFSRVNLRLVNNISVIKGIGVDTGFEFEYEDGLNRGSLSGDFSVSTRFKLSRYIASPFAELNITLIPNLVVTAGARLDIPEDFDNEISPRIGVLYDVKSINTLLRINFGEGFKLPSFFALGNPVVGNTALKPEKSTTFDVGVTQYLWGDRIQATVAYYYSEYKNLIDFEEGPPPLLVNRSKVTVKGFEANTVIEPTHYIKLTGDLTYADSNIIGTTEVLRNRPEWWGGFTLYLRPVEPMNITLRGLFVGEVHDSSIPTGNVVLDPWERFDLTVNIQANGSTKIFFSVENLFDEQYEQFVGFPAPGIGARAGLSVRF